MTKKSKPAKPRRQKFAIWLFDADLMNRLKERALRSGQSVSLLVKNILTNHLNLGESRAATDEEVRAAGQRMVTKHRKSLEKLAAPDRQDMSLMDNCRRSSCQHAKGAHTRGEQNACWVMGCSCPRFMP